MHENSNRVNLTHSTAHLGHKLRAGSLAIAWVQIERELADSVERIGEIISNIEFPISNDEVKKKTWIFLGVRLV